VKVEYAGEPGGGIVERPEGEKAQECRSRQCCPIE